MAIVLALAMGPAPGGPRADWRLRAAALAGLVMLGAAGVFWGAVGARLSRPRFRPAVNASLERFAELVTREQFSLAEACLLIAQDEYPGVDVAGGIARLDAIASTVRGRLAADAAPEQKVAALNPTSTPSSVRRQPGRLLRSAQQLPQRGARAADRHPDHALDRVPRGRPAAGARGAGRARFPATSWSGCGSRAGRCSSTRSPAASRARKASCAPASGGCFPPAEARRVGSRAATSSRRPARDRRARAAEPEGDLCQGGDLEQALAVMQRTPARRARVGRGAARPRARLRRARMLPSRGGGPGELSPPPAGCGGREGDSRQGGGAARGRGAAAVGANPSRSAASRRRT